MTNFILRFLSSLVLAPLFIYIIYTNNDLLILLLLIIFILTIYELKFLIKKNFYIFFLVLFLIIFFLYAFFELRSNKEANFYYLLWLIILVWLTDMGGYFIGKLIGGKRLSKWSPNKTYSGLLGSLAFSQLAIFIVNNFFYLSSYSTFILVLQFTLCLTAIAGDLFFSFIKRKYAIKDYSAIIPGHGGILDRIDGLIFVIIIFYLFQSYYAI